MSFKEVASLDADVTIALGKTNKETGKPYPKQVEGYYLGNRTVESKRGNSKLHFLQTPKGNVGVWGTTDLNRKLSQVVPGTMIRATSTGTKATPKGDMYTYKVETDSSNTIDVSDLTEVSAADDSNSTNYDSDAETNDDSSYESDEDTEQVAALAAAERKAKVEALLKSKGKTVKN